jgi:hypothetical protein
MQYVRREIERREGNKKLCIISIKMMIDSRMRNE